jgi:hypothetical protein
MAALLRYISESEHSQVRHLALAAKFGQVRIDIAFQRGLIVALPGYLIGLTDAGALVARAN